MRIILTIATVLFLAVIGLLGWQNISPKDAKTSATEGSSVSLVRPAFAQTGSFLDQEAGIAAYVKVQNPVNLEGAKQAFKIIEQDTSEFVVGTVQINNGPPYDFSISGEFVPSDPHVFVSSHGWVVAYFLKDESVGNVLWGSRDFKPPNDALVATLARVVGAAVGSAPTSISYFNFEYPEASRISVIYSEDLIYGNFGVQIPNGFEVVEAAVGGQYPRDVTSSIQFGQFQEWQGALILVHREP